MTQIKKLKEKTSAVYDLNISETKLFLWLLPINVELEVFYYLTFPFLLWLTEQRAHLTPEPLHARAILWLLDLHTVVPSLPFRKLKN